METNFIYIVTHYGCNSSSHHMWIPQTKLFINYDEAYHYFLKISPSLYDEENIAEQYINSKYNPNDDNNEYIVIETRVQTGGYLEGNGNCAKRPEGVVIAKSRL